MVFEPLNQVMVTTPVLSLPDFIKPSSIETDARDNALFVLVQGSHSWHSSAWPLASTKKKKSGMDFFTVMMAVDKWCTYLQTVPFMILTDRGSS